MNLFSSYKKSGGKCLLVLVQKLANLGTGRSFPPHGHRIAAPAPGITFLSQHKEEKDSVSYVCPFYEANKDLPGTFLFPLMFHLPE